MKVRTVILAVGLALAAGTIQAQAPSAPAATTSPMSTDCGPKCTATPWAANQMLITVADPPPGSAYGDDYQIEVPAGECWTLKSLAVHLSTSAPIGGAAIRRNEKLIVRDLNDQVGNMGRLFTILALGLPNYSYFDASVYVGGSTFPGLMTAGTASKLFVTHMNGALPDLCIPAGYGWGIILDNQVPNDAFSELWAVVESSPLN